MMAEGSRGPRIVRRMGSAQSERISVRRLRNIAPLTHSLAHSFNPKGLVYESGQGKCLRGALEMRLRRQRNVFPTPGKPNWEKLG
jgi:hypothetical protein